MPMSPPNHASEVVALYSACELPTEFGNFEVKVYRTADDSEHMLILMGDLIEAAEPFVRVHSECYTGEVLGSLKCDCRSQLQTAMRDIAARGCGAIAYLRQEGRGIGLGNKIRAYAEQAKGANTIEANEILGFPVDMRDYSIAARMLLLNGISRVVLNTNNPEKVAALQRAGIEIAEIHPSVHRPNPHNLHYLQTKHDALGHRGLRDAIDDGKQSG